MITVSYKKRVKNESDSPLHAAIQDGLGFLHSAKDINLTIQRLENQKGRLSCLSVSNPSRKRYLNAIEVAIAKRRELLKELYDDGNLP